MSDVFDAMEDTNADQQRAAIDAQRAQLAQGWAGSVNARYVHPLDPEAEAKREARQAEEDARYQAEREREFLAQARGSALHTAAAVCGGSGDPGAVLDAARDFAAFLTGEPPKPH